MTVWTKDEMRSFAAGLRRLARGRAEITRAMTRCDECGEVPADPAPLVTGRAEGVLCRLCWWQANTRGGGRDE
jgi:hypothetical protein